MAVIFTIALLLSLQMTRAGRGNKDNHQKDNKNKQKNKNKNDQDCIKYEIDTSDYIYFDLPSEELPNRDYFPDPDTYQISSTNIKICNNTENNEVYTVVQFRGKGFPLKAPTTVWYEFNDTSDAIFEYTYGFGPLASSKAGFTNGRDVAKEPNVVPILSENGDFDFKIVLDYNPFVPNTIPLLNKLSTVTQSLYCDVSANISDLFCQRPMRRSNSFTFVGMEYLRGFDGNGQQIVDAKGNAMVMRGPSNAGTFVMVTRVDLLSHGMDDGTMTECNSTDPWECSDYYILSMIKLPSFEEIINDGTMSESVSYDSAVSDGRRAVNDENELQTYGIQSENGMISFSIVYFVCICIAVFVCVIGSFLCGYYLRHRRGDNKDVHFEINSKEYEETNVDMQFD